MCSKEDLEKIITVIEKSELSANPQIFEKFIKHHVSKILSQTNKTPELIEYVKTDSIAEIIEKLIILHIRTWILEDKIGENYNNDNLVADLKRKIDICFKQKRPQLIQALNLTLNDAILNGKSLQEDSVKLYKGN